MRKLRVLVLAHKEFLPPEKTTGVDLDKVSWRTEYYVCSALKALGHEVEVLGVEGDLRVIRRAKEQFQPHIAFNLLDAFDGETVFDHNVVSYLELLRLPYTGCNPRGLVLTRDKSICKKILCYHKIKTPHFAVVKRGRKFKRPKNFQFPLIVKSLIEEGSSGISQNSIVNDEVKLNERIEFIHESSVYSDALIESYIEGKDLYVSLLGNRNVKVLPLIELDFKKAPQRIHTIATKKAKWDADYQRKYKIDIHPAKNLSPELTARLFHISKKIYKLLGINGYARFDLRLSSDNEVYFIEANPNPDLAKGDEFSMSANKAGIGYPELLKKIMSLGVAWSPESSYR